MSVNLRNYQKHRIQDFSGGINEFDASFTMDDSQLQEASNVELRSGGAIRSRKGMPRYDIGATTTFPVKSMHHYRRFNGTGNVLIYSDDDIQADDDNGDFVNGFGFTAYGSEDGHCRFAQWRETAFFSTRGPSSPGSIPSESHGIGVYASELATKYRIFGLSGIGSITGEGAATLAVTLTPVTVATAQFGVLVPSSVYQYRFTFDVYHGTTFLGESGVAWINPGTVPGARRYANPEVLLGAADVAVEIRAFTTLAANAGNVSVGAINVYRTIAPVATGVPPTTAIETNMIWVGAIPRAVWADTSTVHILDDGNIAGRSIAPYYARVERPPFGRHIMVHKSRLWTANVKWQYYDVSNATHVQTIAPSRVYFSEVNEPGVFLPTSWVEIHPPDAEGVTAIASFKNKVAIAFTANTMWAISGGDEEIAPGLPDLSVEAISMDIGCVAPDSVQICDGRVVWRSHRGIYYYDGTYPKPLATENIDGTILDLVPQARYDDGASIFLAKEKEYWFSHASQDVNATYQTEISKFSFKNGSWTRGRLASNFGVSAFCEKRRPEHAPVLLAGMEASSSDLSTIGSVFYADVGGYDFDSSSPSIQWSFRTKFYDCNSPFMDKKFVAVLVQLESEADVFVQVSCDNHLVDELFTIENTEGDQDLDDDDGVWDESPTVVGTEWSDGVTGSEWTGDNNRNALIYLNSKCWGKRISFRFSGVTTASQVEIQALTIFYDSKEGVRQ